MQEDFFFQDSMLLLLGQDYFSVEEMHDFDVFNECVTNQPTNQPTDQPTNQRTEPIIEMRGRI